MYLCSQYIAPFVFCALKELFTTSYIHTVLYPMPLSTFLNVTRTVILMGAIMGSLFCPRTLQHPKWKSQGLHHR